MKEEIIQELIKTNSTPAYVFDIDALRKRINYLKSNLTDRIHLCYAIKANSFILKEIENDVEKFEVCSPGEYYICKKLNLEPEKIVISGVYKTPEVIEEMILADKNSEKQIGRYTIESLEQLKLLDELTKKHNIKINTLIRLTSGNQFGINEEDIENIISNKENYPNLNFVGIQYFSGTQKRTNKRLKHEIDALDEFLQLLEEKYNYIPQELEFGTGFPVFYFEGDEFEEQPFLEEFSSDIESMRYQGKIIMELGRSIVASCGTYLTKVVDSKTNHEQNYAILDGGIHHLVYYGQSMAMKVPHMDIYPARDDSNKEQWNLMGSLCTINDIIVKQLPVSNLKVGDVFIFKNTGAYCMMEGISLFLSRNLPKVFLLKDNKLEMVRNDIETYNLNMPNYNK